MEWSRRSVLFVFTVALLCTLFINKNRAPSEMEGSAVFLPLSSAGPVVIRLTGTVPYPGVYNYPPGTSIRSVMELTGFVNHQIALLALGGDVPLSSGDVLEFSEGALESLGLTRRRMGAGERILLCIPLHPDFMNATDWEDVPGIGAGLAQRIVNDRHENGEFSALHGVQRVNGIGARKLKSIQKYFSVP